MTYATVLTMVTSPHARTFFVVDKEEEEKKKTRWATSPPLPKVAKSPSDDGDDDDDDDDTTAFGDDLAATIETTMDAWVLGYKRRDHGVIIVDDRIILSSVQHLSLNFTFTLNRWAHFVTMLKDVDNAAQLRLLECKSPGRCEFLFCRHLGEGYYVTAIYHRHVLDFCRHYVLHGTNSISNHGYF